MTDINAAAAQPSAEAFAPPYLPPYNLQYQQQQQQQQQPQQQLPQLQEEEKKEVNVVFSHLWTTEDTHEAEKMRKSMASTKKWIVLCGAALVILITVGSTSGIGGGYLLEATFPEDNATISSPGSKIFASFFAGSVTLITSCLSLYLMPIRPRAVIADLLRRHSKHVLAKDMRAVEKNYKRFRVYFHKKLFFSRASTSMQI